MQVNVRLLLTATALGLAVSSYGVTLAIPDRDIVSPTGLLVTALLFHFIIHHIRYLLGSQILSSPALKRQFSEKKTEGAVSLIGGSLVYLFAVPAGVGVAHPQIYFAATSAFFVVSAIYLAFQRRYLLSPSGMHRKGIGVTVSGLLGQWITISIVEAGLAFAGWWLTSTVSDSSWRNTPGGIYWGILFALLLIGVVIVEVTFNKELYLDPGRSTREFDAEFEVENSKEFYDEVALVYRHAESADAERLRMNTVRIIGAEIDNQREVRVLDIGGGDGLIYKNFRTHFGVHWTCLDVSEQMLDRFHDQVIDDHRETVEIHCIDVLDASDLERAIEANHRGYDLIVLSIALTSMPTVPDLDTVVDALSGGGLLVISDIEPTYTRHDPYFKVTVDNERIALRTRAVDFSLLFGELSTHNLVLEEWTRVNRDTQPYGFVFSLRKASD